MLSNSGSVVSESFGERHNFKPGSYKWESQQADPMRGSHQVEKQKQHHHLLSLRFALYESDDQMISYHCYVRNTRSLLEKVLETGSFRKMKLFSAHF